MSKGRLTSTNVQPDDEFSLLESTISQIGIEDDQDLHSPSKEVKGAFIGNYCIYDD